jgi:hypothetical protein
MMALEYVTSVVFAILFCQERIICGLRLMTLNFDVVMIEVRAAGLMRGRGKQTWEVCDHARSCQKISVAKPAFLEICPAAIHPI